MFSERQSRPTGSQCIHGVTDNLVAIAIARKQVASDGLWLLAIAASTSHEH